MIFRGSIVLLLWILPVSFVSAEPEALHARVIDSDAQRAPALTIAPEYPRKARRDRIQGEVQVCFDIDRNGRPRRVAVRRSSHRAFEKPSIRAVRASLFMPLDDDQPLQTIKTCRVFVFSLVPEEKFAQEDLP